MWTANAEWLFSGTEVCSTPAVAAGTLWEDELARRASAVYWLGELSMKLSLHRVTFATAATFLHRFWTRESIRRYKPADMLAPVLFLACKVEENHRKLRDIVAEVFEHDALIRGEATEPPPKLDADKAESLRVRALYHEDVLLRVLGYHLSLEHPFTHIIHHAIAFLPVAYDQQPRGPYEDVPDHAGPESREDRLARIAYSICCDRSDRRRMPSHGR